MKNTEQISMVFWLSVRHSVLRYRFPKELRAKEPSFRSATGAICPNRYADVLGLIRRVEVRGYPLSAFGNTFAKERAICYELSLSTSALQFRQS